MSKKLYLECKTGISGDMLVAALLDLGADPEVLRAALDGLHLPGFTVSIGRVQKAGLDVCDFSVDLDDDNKDHDMAYLFGHLHAHAHDVPHEYIYEHDEGEQLHHHREHEHFHEHEDLHEHHHEHEHEELHEHRHEHRGLQEIIGLIENASLSPRAKETACRIFGIIAAAEAKAHGLPLEEVHFHEVGAVDSIVDIVAAAVCLDDLGIEEVITPCLWEGQGSVRCQHGILPIPVPATANIVAAYKLPLQFTDIEGELVTPTGAAIAAAVTTATELPGRFKILRIGLGAGKRSYSRPSILRALLIEEDPGISPETVLQIESNIDDCDGQTLGYVMEKLLAAGALDVFYTPIYMKKNRPAYLLTVLCPPSLQGVMEQLIFSETTTIGLRRCLKERTCLPRGSGTVQLSLGPLAVKQVTLPDGTVKIYPEYESAALLARANGLSLGQVLALFAKEV